MSWSAAENRYESMTWRRCGRSGLQLPALALGLWHNFGGVDSEANARAMLLHAFDRGITHVDLANNYGPPPGSAEAMLGRVLADDLAAYRDELIVATKAGFRHWPGPYGVGGSRKYLLASLDASLQRLGLDYVDIFYSHTPDYETPLEETVQALASVVQQGKALYVGISNYRTERAAEALRLLREAGVPAVLHQARYNILDRWVVEDGLLEVLDEHGCGCISFSPLAQGLLTDKYLDGVPADSRAAKAHGQLQRGVIDDALLRAVRALGELAAERGQSLAQMALAWNLRHPQMSSVVIGASRVEQIDANLGALANLAFSPEELARIEAIHTERQNALQPA